MFSLTSEYMHRHFAEAEQVKLTRLKRDKDINHITDLIENKLHVVMDTYEVDKRITPPSFCDISLVYGRDYTDANCIFSAIEIIKDFGFTVTEPRIIEKKIVETASIDESFVITVSW